MKYIAMDFEAGNRLSISACSIGLAYYEDDRLLERQSFLIQPPPEAGDFDWCAVKIHGIKRARLKNEPTFPAVWEKIKHYFEDAIIVCHNAAYDTRVLCECLAFYGLPRPQCGYLCTVVLSRKVWPDLGRYRLNLMAERLNIPLKHHDASSDAFACGEILQYVLQITACKDAQQMLQLYNLPLLQMADISLVPKDKSKDRYKRRRPAEAPEGAPKARVTVTSAKPRAPKPTPATPKQVKPKRINKPQG